MRHNDDFRIEIVDAIDIDEDRLEDALLLLSIGGAVDLGGLRGRLKAALMLAFALLENRVVSVGAIKRPNQAYVTAVSRKSAFAIPETCLELGYVATDEQYQGNGLARRVCGELCARYTEVLFATTTSDTMLRILRDLGFDRVGLSWPSEQTNGKILSLLLRTEGDED